MYVSILICKDRYIIMATIIRTPQKKGRNTKKEQRHKKQQHHNLSRKVNNDRNNYNHQKNNNHKNKTHPHLQILPPHLFPNPIRASLETLRWDSQIVGFIFYRGKPLSTLSHLINIIPHYTDCIVNFCLQLGCSGGLAVSLLLIILRAWETVMLLVEWWWCTLWWDVWVVWYWGRHGFGCVCVCVCVYKWICADRLYPISFACMLVCVYLALSLLLRAKNKVKKVWSQTASYLYFRLFYYVCLYVNSPS